MMIVSSSSTGAVSRPFGGLSAAMGANDAFSTCMRCMRCTVEQGGCSSDHRAVGCATTCFGDRTHHSGEMRECRAVHAGTRCACMIPMIAKASKAAALVWLWARSLYAAGPSALQPDVKLDWLP